MEKGNSNEDDSKIEENQKVYLANMFEKKLIGKSAKNNSNKNKSNGFDMLGKRSGFGKDKVKIFIK